MRQAAGKIFSSETSQLKLKEIFISILMFVWIETYIQKQL